MQANLGTIDKKDLNNLINQFVLIDIYKTFHPLTREHTFFSDAQEIFNKRDHILYHKTDLNKFKMAKVIENILSAHKGIKLDINNRYL